MNPHTFVSNPNTKPIIEAVGKCHFGSQDRSNQPSKHVEFLRLVELLADTVCSLNFRHYLGLMPLFLGIYAVLVYTHLHNLGAGGQKACKTP